MVGNLVHVFGMTGMTKVCKKHNVEYIPSGKCLVCPECRRETNSRYEQRHTEQRKAWRTTEAGKTCRLKYDRSAKRKASKKKNRHKMRAREAVRRAVNKGILVPCMVCPECKQQTKTEAHHHRGYEKSYQLDVVWLCHSCHLAIHNG